MKILRFVFLTLAACLLLGVTGFAAEAEEGEESLIVTVEYELPELIDGDGGYWGDVALMDSSSWTGMRYKDQLPEEGKRIYNKLEELFPEEIAYKDVEFSTSNAFCAAYEEELPTITINGSDETPVKEEEAKLHKQYDSLVSAVYYAFIYDHPEYFWIRTHGSGALLIGVRTWSYSTGEVVKRELIPTIAIRYVLRDPYKTKKVRTDTTEEVNAAVSSILSQCNGLSTFSKLEYFDDWLAKNNTYNDDAAKDKIDIAGPIPWNATSALLTKTASPVCEGYAKAFQLLCHRSGIPCVTISGGDPESEHMWNAVMLEGKWYYVDCTHDDRGNFSDKSHFLKKYLTSTGCIGQHTMTEKMFATPLVEGDYTPTEDWALGANGVRGSKIVTSGGKFWMALYNGNDKMLGLLPCESMSWSNNQVRVLAPQFSSSVVSQAEYGKVFVVDETSWKPAEAAKEFYKAG